MKTKKVATKIKAATKKTVKAEITAPVKKVGPEKNNAMHFFLYLIAFFALGFIAFGTGSILFQVINKFHPDELTYDSFDQTTVKFGIASLLIAGPIFFWVMWNVVKKQFKGEITVDSKIRKWLTYIVLFFAAATMIGDLITLVFYFLDGDIPVRFLLKVMTVFLIAGSIFNYFYWDIKKATIVGKRFEGNLIAFVSSISFLIVLFVGAFFIIDSPKVAREKKIDMQTIGDLSSIESAIRGYYDKTGQLPETLNQLKRTEYYISMHQEGNISYEKKSETSFDICADFIHPNFEDKNPMFEQGWNHDRGRECFERDVVRQINVKDQINL